MKSIIAVAALLACCQAAFGQTTECRGISDSTQRLACYDKISPPATTAASGSQSANKSKASNFVDPTLVDDKMLDSRIKGICRGC